MTGDLTKDINIRAVAIGMLADIGGTLVFSFVFGLIAVIVLSADGKDINQIVKQIEEFSKTPVFIVTTTCVGLLFTSFGGFITARTAKKAELKNAFFMGFASVMIGTLFVAISFNFAAFWPDMIFQFLTMPFAVLGGYVYVKNKAADIQKKMQ